MERINRRQEELFSVEFDVWFAILMIKVRIVFYIVPSKGIRVGICLLRTWVMKVGFVSNKMKQSSDIRISPANLACIDKTHESRKSFFMSISYGYYSDGIHNGRTRTLRVNSRDVYNNCFIGNETTLSNLNRIFNMFLSNKPTSVVSK